MGDNREGDAPAEPPGCRWGRNCKRGSTGVSPLPIRTGSFGALTGRVDGVAWHPGLKKAMALQAGPPGFEPHAVTHAWPLQRSVIPAHAGIQSLSETGPNWMQTDARVPPKCTGIALNHAQDTLWWCTRGAFRGLHGTLQDRQPAFEWRHSRAGGNPVCQKPAPIRRRRMPLEPPECTAHAPNMHWWCTRGAFRTLHDALRNSNQGKMRKMRWETSFVIPTQDIRPTPWAAASVMPSTPKTDALQAGQWGRSHPASARRVDFRPRKILAKTRGS